ncbi:MAG: TlpA family protein disulfide reductase [Anaerolineae bacterium]|jgi:peroxiredoxin
MRRPSSSQSPLTSIALIGLGVLLVVAGYSIYTTLWGPARVAAEVGARAPDFTVRDLEGDEVHLSDYRGRPVLLNFRTTWCGYCRQEATELQAAHESIPELVILGVYVDESAAEVAAYRAAAGLTFPSLLDPGGETALLYGVHGIPRSFFLDAGGVITVEHTGPLTVGRIQSYLSQGR